jgi:hypothetical protein
VTESIVLVQESSGDCAVRVLHETVQVAVHGMLGTACDLASVNAVLATVLGAVEPVYPQLEAMAAAQPAGPVAAALFHLRAAFGHAAGGRPEPAVSSVVTASAMTSRLQPAGVLDTEGDDVGLWR